MSDEGVDEDSRSNDGRSDDSVDDDSVTRHTAPIEGALTWVS